LSNSALLHWPRLLFFSVMNRTTRGWNDICKHHWSISRACFSDGEAVKPQNSLYNSCAFLVISLCRLIQGLIFFAKVHYALGLSLLSAFPSSNEAKHVIWPICLFKLTTK
jgi:hypothetical protein